MELRELISTERPSFRLFVAVRMVWGAVLLLSPQTVLQDLPHGQIHRTARAIARILGARHLLEATLTGRRPSRRRLQIGAALDASHAATMLALAASKPSPRKLALSNAATAAAFAFADVVEIRRGRERGYRASMTNVPHRCSGSSGDRRGV